MAVTSSVTVTLVDESRVAHVGASKWVIDENRNLVILGKDKTAVAIYAVGQWAMAEVAA